MAKKSTVNKLTKKQMQAQQLKEEYRRVRENLQQNVRRLKKRGYDVGAIEIPKIPEKIGKKAINELKKLNERRYQLATKIELVKHRDATGQIVEELQRVSGKVARGYERRRAGAKASYTHKERRKTQAKRKSEKRTETPTKREPIVTTDFYDYDDSYYERYDDEPVHSEDAVFDYNSEEWIEPSPEPDFEKNAYFMDTETGEIVERPWGAKKPKREGTEFVRVLPPTEQGKLAYEKAIQDLDLMSSYMGDKGHGRNLKHDAITRQNADEIKKALEEMHGKNPALVEEALLWTFTDADYHSPDYMYRAGGYKAYLGFFNNILSNLGENVSYETDEDYDEGNFDY